MKTSRQRSACLIAIVLALALGAGRASAVEIERFGRYVLVQEVGGGGTRSNTHAICEVSHVAGATSYRLVSRGGNDPDFYGEQINKFGPLFDSDHLPARPAGVHWWGLSGSFGPIEDAGSQKAWMDGRFGSGWDWRVLIDTAELTVTISAGEAEVAIGDDIDIQVFVVNRGEEPIHDIRLDGEIAFAGDGSVVQLASDGEWGTLAAGTGTSRTTTFEATATGQVVFSAPQVTAQTDDGLPLSVTPVCDNGADPAAAPCTGSGLTVEILPCELDVSLSNDTRQFARLVGDAHPPVGGEYRPGDT